MQVSVGFKRALEVELRRLAEQDPGVDVRTAPGWKYNRTIGMFHKAMSGPGLRTATSMVYLKGGMQGMGWLWRIAVTGRGRYDSPRTFRAPLDAMRDADRNYPRYAKEAVTREQYGPSGSTIKYKQGQTVVLLTGPDRGKAAQVTGIDIRRKDRPYQVKCLDSGQSYIVAEKALGRWAGPRHQSMHYGAAVREGYLDTPEVKRSMATQAQRLQQALAGAHHPDDAQSIQQAIQLLRRGGAMNMVQANGLLADIVDMNAGSRNIGQQSGQSYRTVRDVVAVIEGHLRQDRVRKELERSGRRYSSVVQEQGKLYRPRTQAGDGRTKSNGHLAFVGSYEYWVQDGYIMRANRGTTYIDSRSGYRSGGRSQGRAAHWSPEMYRMYGFSAGQIGQILPGETFQPQLFGAEALLRSSEFGVVKGGTETPESIARFLKSTLWSQVNVRGDVVDATAESMGEPVGIRVTLAGGVVSKIEIMTPRTGKKKQMGYIVTPKSVVNLLR